MSGEAITAIAALVGVAVGAGIGAVAQRNLARERARIDELTAVYAMVYELLAAPIGVQYKWATDTLSDEEKALLAHGLDRAINRLNLAGAPPAIVLAADAFAGRAAAWLMKRPGRPDMDELGVLIDAFTGACSAELARLRGDKSPPQVSRV